MSNQLRFCGDENPELVLINTPLYPYSDTEGQSHEQAYHVPLGLSYIASYAHSIGKRVAVTDGEADQASIEAIAREVNRIKPKWCGINIFTANADLTRQLVDLIDPSIKIMIGGPHATTLPEDVLRHPTFKNSVLVRGEGEKKVAALLQDIPKKQIPGLSYREGDQIVHNPDNTISPEWIVADLDTLRLDRRYVPNHPFVGKDGVVRACVLGSRSCPMDCTFCAGARQGRGNKVRQRSPQSIVEEIEELYKEGVRDIKFEDDLALISEKRIRGIFEELMRRGISKETGFSWRANGRANIIQNLSEDVLDILALSGASKIFMGVERGSDAALKEINKHITMEQVRTSIVRLISRKIDVLAYFMLGFPNETEEEMKRTLSFAQEIHALAEQQGGKLTVSAYKYRPYPGTTDWNRLIAGGRTAEELLKYELRDDTDTLVGRGAKDYYPISQISAVPLQNELRLLTDLRQIGNQVRRRTIEAK
ncbi:MAG: radical SAM protein [bacterium]